MFSPFLDRTLTASTLHNGCGMSTRPAFYSGRGATSSDLDSSKLDRIFAAIQIHKGDLAAKAFVSMVAAIPVLSATDFLLALSALERNDWQWSDRLLGSQKGVYATDHAEAFATVMTVASEPRTRDETLWIRSEFLHKHGVREPRARDAYNNPYGDWR